MPRLAWGQSAVYSAFVSLGFLALSNLFSFLLCPASALVLFPLPSVSPSLRFSISLLFLFLSLCLSAGHPDPASDSSQQSTNPILHDTYFEVTKGGHIQSLEALI